jgi:hypothetical protein
MLRRSLLLVLLAACTQAPVLPGDRAPDVQNAPYPALAPLGPILDAAGLSGETDPAGTLDSRAAALDARGAALRGPVLDADALARLDGGVDSTALQ